MPQFMNVWGPTSETTGAMCCRCSKIVHSASDMRNHVCDSKDIAEMARTVMAEALRAALVDECACPECLGDLDDDGYCTKCGLDTLGHDEPEWC